MFEHDGDKAKEAYRDRVREHLMVLLEKEAEGTLTGAERLHPAYTHTEAQARTDGGDSSDSSDEGELLLDGQRVAFSTARFGASTIDLANRKAVLWVQFHSHG